MSRIGKKPVSIPSGVTVTVDEDSVHVQGLMGTLRLPVSRDVLVVMDQHQLTIAPKNGDHGMHLVGLTRSLLHNAVVGVSTGWTKQLEMVGVGYRVQTNGSELTVHVGFAHPVILKAPPGTSFHVAENKITVSGYDKYTVGEVAASLRRIKPPEPYKGKGIRYAGEYIRKKVGKAGKAVGGTGGTK